MIKIAKDLDISIDIIMKHHNMYDVIELIDRPDFTVEHAITIMNYQHEVHKDIISKLAPEEYILSYLSH